MKRKKSEGHKKEKKKKTCNNRFLELQKAAFPLQVNDEQESVLSSVLEFSEHSDESSSDVVERLVAHLNNETTTTDASRTVPQVDVANMLLPWAIKHCDYKTLHSCLHVLLSCNKEHPSCLSQSALHKLVPCCAETAMNGDDAAADCFALLVDKLYRPTLDVACHALLPLLDVSISNKVVPTKEHLKVVESTLKLLLHASKGCSPKKSFQTLTEVKVLDVISKLWLVERTQDEIRQLLREGLFSPVHHMEGFWSMNMPVPSTDATTSTETQEDEKGAENKGFHQCYQQKLLETMNALVADKYSVIAAGRFIPELLNEFIQQSNIWERDYTNKTRRRKDANFCASVQFRFFSNLVWPMVLALRKSVDENSSILSIVHSLRQCLTLVLKHDVYLPSYTDKNNVNYSFLELITSELLSILSLETDNRVESECLQGIETLISLNHLVVHERLKILISASARVKLSDELEGEVQSHQRRLFTTIVKTYHKLRQLDHLFRSLLHAADNVQNDSSGKGPTQDGVLLSLKRIFQDNSVHTELSEAVQRCPQGQIQDLFKQLNGWIARSSKKEPANITEKPRGQAKDEPTSDVSFAARLFVLLIRNVKVDHYTALGVANLCEEAINETARPFMDENRADESSVEVGFSRPLSREALVLCGWLVDLRTRCVFWLTDKDRLALKSEGLDIVTMILDHAALGSRPGEELETLRASSYGRMLGEMQLLASHRIRELHSLIHEEQRAELINRERGLGASKLIDEVERLVGLVFAIAERYSTQLLGAGSSETGMSESGWKIVAETIPYWAPYSKSSHVKTFFSWLFSILAADADEALADASVSSLRLYPRRVVSARPILIEELAIASALLRDASFFEVPELATHFHSTGLEFVARLLRIALKIESEGEKEEGETILLEGLDLLPTGNSGIVPGSDRKLGPAMITLAINDGTNPVEDRNINVEVLRRALRVMLVMNGVTRSSGSQVDFDKSIRLDVLLQAVCLQSSNVASVNTPFQLLCATRMYSSKAMLLGRDCIDDIQGLNQFIRGLIRSTAVLGNTAHLNTNQQELLRASASLIGATTLSCLAIFDENEEPLRAMFNCFKKLVRSCDSEDGFYTCVLMHLVRSHVTRMTDFISQDVDGMEEFKRSTVLPFIESTEEVFGKIEKNHQLLSPKGYYRAEWLALMGDISRFSHVMQSEVPKTIDLKIVRDAFYTEDETHMRAATYHLACHVDSCGSTSSSAVSELVADLCSMEKAKGNQLLDATFCRILSGMGAVDVRQYLTSLLSNTQSKVENRVSALRLFQFSLDHVTDEQARIEIRSVARAYFALSLELLHPQIDEVDVSLWAGNIELGVSLIVSLTQQKDIIEIRERDLALVLAQAETTLGQAGSFRNPGARSVEDRVYSSCFSLVSALLQRFPKQLYACVPCVISVMHSLQRHALYGSLSQPEALHRAQLFARLCELLMPHKDVYKKHILGLILEYVGALRCDVHPSRSKGLVPAVYCLLDMLSQYETEQLNTMMDTTAKALFRSVYQSYQKTHMYKGQY